jgi:glycosyltransferase involved in cell wall biosynthesis
MPIFTVIISTYNRKHVLPRAISSVIGQTFGDFELIVIDNGSTDGTEAAVSAIRDPRIKYVRNPEPTTSCDGPRNMGIGMAKSGYIAFLDDDDIWYPQRLAKVKDAFERDPDVSAVCHNENRNYKGKVDKVLEYGPWSADIYERLLYDGNCLSSCATTVKKDVFGRLGGFDLRDEYAAAADYDFWLRMTGSGAKICFIEEPLGEFGYTGKNWSSADPAFQSRIAALIRDHIVRFENKPVDRISDRGMLRLIKLYLIASKSFFSAFRIADALKYLSMASWLAVKRPHLIIRMLSVDRSGKK